MLCTGTTCLTAKLLLKSGVRFFQQAMDVTSSSSLEVDVSFKVGDSVSFTGRRGAMLKGVVDKVKVKYLLIRTTTGQRWNVPGSHLKLIKLLLLQF